MSEVVNFPKPTETGAYGRNGCMQAHGIEVSVWSGELHLQQVVSQGRVSSAAQLSVPLSEIPALIAALKKVSS